MIKNKLLEELIKEERINILISNFKEEFESTMLLLGENQFNFMMNFRETIYRKWLYNPIIVDTIMTPYFIINSIAQSINTGDYSITPHLKISFNPEKRIFNYDFNIIYYEEEEIPVLKDLEIIMNFANPTINILNDNNNSIQRADEILEQLTFRSSYYVKYLINLSERMGLIEEIKAIGCKCYKLSIKYEEYLKSSSKEKVKNIIDNSIEYSDINLKKELGSISKETTLKYLDNNIERKDFLKLSQGNSLEFFRFMETLNPTEAEKFGMDEKQLHQINFMKKQIGDEEFKNHILSGEIGIQLDMYFTNVFSYYLGIIIPNYAIKFRIEEYIKLLLNVRKEEDLITLLFGLEGYHDLTNLGTKILKEKKEILKEKKFKFLDDNEINFIMKSYIEELNVEEDKESSDISKVINNFGDYLYNNKKISESTVVKHCDNIILYLELYNEFKSVKEFKKIRKEDVDAYLIEYFIPSFATSKTSVKEYIVSLNHFIKYIEFMDYIEKEEGKKIRDLLKNKDKYINVFKDLFYL